STDVVLRVVGEFLLECRIITEACVRRGQLLQRRDQRFRNKRAAIHTEAAMRVGISVVVDVSHVFPGSMSTAIGRSGAEGQRFRRAPCFNCSTVSAVSGPSTPRRCSGMCAAGSLSPNT